jgi:hypothetical protein
MERSSDSANSAVRRAPELSAILPMARGFAAIRKTVGILCRQTACQQLELVIVTTPEQVAELDRTMLSPLAAWQVVTIPSMPTLYVGWTAGIRAAKAPAVVLCEDHSFPEPNWAQALIEAHRGNYAAVAPAVKNGNPESLISWANFLLCFIEWFSPEESRPVMFGPGHNTSYKRDVLLGYDSQLESWLNPERLLQFELIDKGHRLFLESRAATNHVNISLAGSYFSQSFLGGRIFGASRAARWSRGRAWMQALAFPLIPVVRLKRILGNLDTPARRKASKFWTALPWTMAGLCLHAFGEAVGYVVGAGNSDSRYLSFESRRGDHVKASDKPLLMESAPASQARGVSG